MGGADCAQDKIKIGYAVSKTGPNAAGRRHHHDPQLQALDRRHQEGGRLKLGDRIVPIEVVEYDDQSSTEELFKHVERLVNEDKVDILLPPWGTGMNLAVGPTFAKYGYPQMAATAATDHAYEIAARWPNSFWMLGTSTMGANALVEVLTKLKDAGKINNKIAMVSVADAFGIELAGGRPPRPPGRRLRSRHGRELSGDYPGLLPAHHDRQGLGRRHVCRRSATRPTRSALTGAAIAVEYNPPAFYTAVGTAFPVYKDQLFHDNVDGVLGVGGVNTDEPKFQDYANGISR